MNMVLVGNAGIITAISSQMITFINIQEKRLIAWISLATFFGAIFMLLIVAQSK